jgi:plastocyanin domain-containing protein
MKLRLVVIAVSVVTTLLTIAASAQQTEPQTAKVLITKNGFEPNSLELKVNVPAKVTFLRQTNDTCATSVVILEYKVKKDMPLN